MPQMQDEAGNIWEVDAQGNPVGLVQAAGARQQGQVFSLPQSPEKQAAEARAAAAEARAQAGEGRAANDQARQDALAPLETELKRLQVLEAEQKLGAGEKGSTKLNSLIAQINRVQELYDESIGKTKGLAGALDYLPTDAAKRFDTAGAQLSQIGLAAFRTPGTGTVSDRDAIMFDKGNLPTAGTRDAAIEEILGGLRRRVEEAYQGKDKPQWTGVAQDQQDAPALASPMGGDPPNPWRDSGPSGPTIAGGPTRQVAVNEKIASQIDAMMNAGASKAMIDTVLKQQGIAPISPSEYTAAKTWMKQNPGKSYYGARSTKTEDMSYLQRIAGSETGSLLANMADGFTAGTSTALAGDKGKAALEAMQAVNPGYSAAGSILGGITGAGLAEVGLAARAPQALAKYAPRIADTGYGALAGFNGAEDGQGGTGAATGAVAGLVGGLVGEGAMRGVGAAARGVTDPAAQYLRSLNVPLTVGQAMGGGVKKIEDALTSIPFVGNMIERRRGEGLDAFNRAAFDIGAETTGNQVQDIGANGINQLAALRSQAYDNALGPVRIDATEPQFGQDIASALGSAQRISNVNSAQDAAIAGLQSRIDGAIDPATDQMTGRGFQEAYRGLARTGRERANSDYGAEVGQVMREGQDALAGALERQNPGAYQGFIDANTANRRLMVLADAVDKAKNHEGRFMPSQLNMADAASANRLTGKVSSAGGDRPFAELAAAGQQVLPSKMGDSGTYTRALVGLGATGGLGGAGYAVDGGEGAGTGTGLGLGATLALALGGSKGAQSLAVRGLMDRPDLAVAIGEALKRNARVGSAAGAGMGTYLGTMLAE